MAISYAEVLSQTSVVVTGVLKSVNAYESKDKTYWSLDVEVKGTRNPIVVRLPQKSNLQTEMQSKIYTLISLPCCVKPTFGGKGYDLEAL